MFLLATAMAFAPVPAFAQAGAPAAAPAAAAAPLPDADPALWVVRDADTNIYLFGTFHMLDGRPWFNDEVRTAFDGSSELVMEAILPDDPAALQPLILQYAIDPQGRTLPSRLSPLQYMALMQALANAGVPPTAFDRFEPWFVSMTLAVLGAQRLGIGSAEGPETVLTAAAHARHIPIGELEGMERQLQMLDGMPEAMQIEQLAETLRENDEIATKLAPMLAAWSAGDVERLAALMTATPIGRAGSRRGWRSPAPSSSPSAQAISPAPTASRPRFAPGASTPSGCRTSKRISLIACLRASPTL
jgi:uncharacterized protein YbaP (TraB family)